MSGAQESSGGLSSSLYNWGAGWVEYAQQQLTGLLGEGDLEVRDPNQGESASGADLVNPNDERQQFWMNMKQYIGHDITSLISVPVWIMEPLTMLQRMAEIMEYTELLDQADKSTDKFKRLALLFAFCVTPYGAIERPWKPFNPILGETFELKCGNGVNFMSEQVSHHPPIGAAHAENAHFSYDIVSAPKSKFLGNSVEIYPLGRSRIRLKSSGEEFYLIPPTARACNIIVGRTWIDNYGPLHVVDAATGDTAHVEFTPCGWFGKGRYEFSGYVTEAATGLRKYKLTGMWNDYCDCVPVMDDGETICEKGPSERLWQCKEKPRDDAYGRTHFSLSLNQCGSGDQEPLPTDSRRRPDRAALEADDSAASGAWKSRLEESQRAERREREKQGSLWKPRWFSEMPHPHPKSKIFDGEYSLDDVPCWVWKGDSESCDERNVVADKGSSIGRGFMPWEYPELHAQKDM